MSRLNQAREALSKARDIQNAGTRTVLEFKQRFGEEVSKIARIKGLSEEGRHIVRDEIREVLGMEFMQKSHRDRIEFIGRLRDAVTFAESFIRTSVKKPDDGILTEFEASLRELKTQLFLSTSADRALAKIDEFIAKVNDPYLAGMLRDEFGGLATSVMGATGSNDQVRLKLSQTFERLKMEFDSEEVREARTILDAANAALADPTVYNRYAVEATVTDMFGRAVANNINTTDQFFAKEENAAYNPENQSPKAIQEQSQRAASLRYALRIDQ